MVNIKWSLTLLILITGVFSVFGNEHSVDLKSIFHIHNGMVDTNRYQIISKGGEAGDYQAFPDACRLQNGDIAVVFYGGDSHVTYPSSEYPNSGRICMVRSSDEGQTWSKPITIFDDPYDNRDPHIAQLKDGRIVVTFFSLILSEDRQRKPGGIYFISSSDQGDNWDEIPRRVSPATPNWYCSAPMREMSNGTLIFPVYTEVKGIEHAWGGVFLSYDGGKSWTDVIPIGKEANLYLAAETDVIRLKNGDLLAALRGQKEVPMHFSRSKDIGKTWSDAYSSGFLGHSPHLNRLSTGEILLTYRGIKGNQGYNWDEAYTALLISFDDGVSWQGPYLMDESGGAYPSTVELSDGTILLIFYEEGKGSGIGSTVFEKPENEGGAPSPEMIHVVNN